MTNKKKYSSVSELLHDTQEQGEVYSHDEFETIVNSQKLIKELIALRTVAGMSQKQIADKMDCTQSRVSKLENSCDDDLSMGDVRQYMLALDIEMMVGGKRKHWTLVDEIKCLAVAIKRKLEKLAELADKDKSIASGIASFYAEAFVNFNKMLIDNAERLPSNPTNGEPYVTFYLGDDDEDDDELDAHGHAVASDSKLGEKVVHV